VLRRQRRLEIIAQPLRDCVGGLVGVLFRGATFVVQDVLNLPFAIQKDSQRPNKRCFQVGWCYDCRLDHDWMITEEMVDSNSICQMSFDMASNFVTRITLVTKVGLCHVVWHLRLKHERLSPISIPLNLVCQCVLGLKSVRDDIVSIDDTSNLHRVVAVPNLCTAFDMVCAPQPRVVHDDVAGINADHALRLCWGWFGWPSNACKDISHDSGILKVACVLAGRGRSPIQESL